jgi:two-component system OmpR family response regulator
MQSPDSAASRAPRVLVVDDDPLLTSVLAKALRASGFEVDVADNGRDGLERAAEVAPAVVIVDVTMPVMNGYEFEAFRAIPEYAAVPIILASGTRRLEEVRRRIEGMGVVLFMAKPFDLETLLAAVIGMTRERGGSSC